VPNVGAVNGGPANAPERRDCGIVPATPAPATPAPATPGTPATPAPATPGIVAGTAVADAPVAVVAGAPVAVVAVVAVVAAAVVASVAAVASVVAASIPSLNPNNPLNIETISVAKKAEPKTIVIFLVKLYANPAIMKNNNTALNSYITICLYNEIKAIADTINNVIWLLKILLLKIFALNTLFNVDVSMLIFFFIVYIILQNNKFN